MLDVNVGVVLEQLLAGRHVVLVVVDPKHAGLFEAVDDSREGSSSGSADVQHLLHCFVVLVAFSDLPVGGSEWIGEYLVNHSV